MALNEYGQIMRIGLRHARDAFRDSATIDTQWQALNYHARPGYDDALAEYDAFMEALMLAGADVHLLPYGDGLSIDSIYVRDASIPSPGVTT